MTLTQLFAEVESDEEPETEPPELPKGRPPKSGRKSERRTRAVRKK